jgi:hypothetical protein
MPQIERKRYVGYISLCSHRKWLYKLFLVVEPTRPFAMNVLGRKPPKILFPLENRERIRDPIMRPRMFCCENRKDQIRNPKPDPDAMLLLLAHSFVRWWCCWCCYNVV